MNAKGFMPEARPDDDNVITAVARIGERGRRLVIDAEIVVVLDEPAARRLDQRIRLTVTSIESGLAKLAKLVAEAKAGDIHVALGFASWTAYLAEAVQIEPHNRAERCELVAMLTGEGVSQRAIADMMGVSKRTIQNDQAHVDTKYPPDTTPAPVAGRDGKSYQRDPRPTPPPTPRRNHLRILSRIAQSVAGVAMVLDDIDQLDDTVTAQKATHILAELSEFAGVFSRTNDLLQIRSGNRPGATTYSAAIQMLSASIADDCASLTDEQVVEALGAAQFLYEMLRGETITRKRGGVA